MAYYRPSSPQLELELTICSAKDLKNVSWRHGDLKPYAVAWVDPSTKSTTKVDDTGDTCPVWNETLVIPLTSPVEDSTLHIDIVHAYAEGDTKPLTGSARISVKEIVDDAGFGEWAHRSLKLKRPSGRPHGKLEIKALVRQPRYRAPDPYYAPPYGVPPPPPQTAPYPNYASAPSGHPYAYTERGYSAPPAYTQEAYGAPGYSGPVEQKKSGRKFGVGTGLAVGAVAGVLGGLAIAEGVDYVEDKIADDAAEKVEDDLGYDDDDDF